VIRPMARADWPEVRAIYAAGIATGNATFETEAPEWGTWDAGHLHDLRFVALLARSASVTSQGTLEASWS
jgi:L-amino acid N-acyltransferase YncA